ncbi:O-antigen ligase family protein [Dictyobacter formicarum]|uniref:O-antigen ligase-related domain-containing protein n=1 Tax=Dictyobacter formicarum TaxID=2778368 RepID=A0ABQ3V895_9CHLR|nr:O-antigen ligase family protein [Dictyobacter formicarum]GHO82087.1 hypothetical protein KSZ_00930 [Dictyobacter formicarum]
MYLLIAAPSIAFPLAPGGLPFRLFVGNIVFTVFLIVGLLRSINTKTRPSAALLPAHILLPAMLLILLGFVSIIYSRLNPAVSISGTFPHTHVAWTLLNIAEMLLLFGLPVVLIATPQFIQHVRDVRRIIIAYAVLGVVYALVVIWTTPLEHYIQLMILTSQRPSTFSMVTGVTGTQLVFFVCIALGQALYARQRVAACCWWLVTLILILATILSFERTAWITLCISSMMTLGLRYKNIGVLPLILAILLPLLIPIILNTIIPVQNNSTDYLLRWQEAFSIWQRYPWLGIGAGNYQFVVSAYGADAEGGAHNQFLEVLVEMGLQGILCLLWMVIAIGYISLRRFKQAATAAGKAITLSYLGYYVTLLILSVSGDSFLPSVTNANGTATQILASYHWFLLGIVLTLPKWETAGTHPVLPKPLSGPQKQLQTEKKPLS